MTGHRLRWVLLGLAGIALVVHSLQYNFVTDDAYISFVFSRNFAEHGQLAFNLGHPVEGYTNFLWTLILGVLMLAGIAPEGSSRVLGTICALVTLYLVMRIMDRALGRKSPWSAAPALGLAMSSGFACWTSGGLETQLFTMLVAAALEATVAATEEPRALRRAGLCLALAAMTRPEGLIVAVILGAVRLLHLVLTRPGWKLREELIAAGAFLALWAPWFAWRTWYYGHLAPNTYYVKASGPWVSPKLASDMWANGVHYIWVWLQQTRLLWGLPLVLVGLVSGTPRTPRFTLVVASGLMAAVYIPYAISVGGDFMGLHRFIMPLFVIAALLVVLGLEWLVARLPVRHQLPVALVTGGLLFAGFAYSQVKLTRTSLDPRQLANDRGIDTPAFLIVYTEDRAAIGRAMAPCFQPTDFSIVGGAGAQPYFGRMRAIDVFGLVSERIAHDEPRVRARAGHTKFGNDRLLADYEPTFVFSCYRIHRTAEQPQLPCAGFWKARDYEQVTMHIPGMREQGEYYTFLAKRSRAFACPGRVQ